MKKSNKTNLVIENVEVSVWKGTYTLTAETAVEYFQLRMTAEEAKAFAERILSGK